MRPQSSPSIVSFGLVGEPTHFDQQHLKIRPPLKHQIDISNMKYRFNFEAH